MENPNSSLCALSNTIQDENDVDLFTQTSDAPDGPRNQTLQGLNGFRKRFFKSHPDGLKDMSDVVRPYV